MRDWASRSWRWAILICLSLCLVHPGLEALAAQKKSPAKPAAEQAQSGHPMAFTLVRDNTPGCEPNCAQWIAAEGEITSQTPAKLSALLAKPENRKLPVFVNSPGGRVLAAMQMGRMLRKYGMNVALAWSYTDECSALSVLRCGVNNQKVDPLAVHVGYAREGGAYCNSACSWILLAGTVRIASANTHIGLHQPHETEQRWVDHYWDTWRIINGKKHIISHKFVKRTYLKAQYVQGVTPQERPLYLKYIKEMGGSPAILDEMQKASPANLNEISFVSGDRQKLGLTNDSITTLSAFFGADHCKTAGKFSGNCVPLAPSAKPAPPSTPSVKALPDEANIPGQDLPMTFSVMREGASACEPRCAQWIAAVGRITPATPQKLAAVLADSHNTALPILLQSRGGDLSAAMELGRLIHRNGMNTAIAHTVLRNCAAGAICPTDPNAPQYGSTTSEGAYCDGACVLAFLAGKVRIAEDAADIKIEAVPSRDLGLLSPYLKDIGSSYAIFDVIAVSGANVAVRVLSSQQRADLEVVSSPVVPLNLLVGPSHCKTYGKLSVNCVDANEKGPQQTAAP